MRVLIGVPDYLIILYYITVSTIIVSTYFVFNILYDLFLILPNSIAIFLVFVKFYLCCFKIMVYDVTNVACDLL